MNKVRYALVAAIGFVAAMPGKLEAHTRLTRAEPAAQSLLYAAPTAIRLWFSEAPELRFTSIVVKDSTGAPVPLGAVTADSSGRGIQAAIAAPIRAGNYVVSWRVAGVDGHPITGSFRFTVLRSSGSPAPDTPSVAVKDPEPDSVGGSPISASHVIARAIGFAALLILIGAVVTHVAIIPRAIEPGSRRVVSTRLAAAALLAAAAGAGAGAVRLLLQWQLLNSGGPAAVSVSTLVTDSHWGSAWMVQMGALILAAVGFLLARGGSRIGWVTATAAALALSVAPALGGHAGATTTLREVAIAADGLHVLAAAGWLGSLFCVVAVVIPPLINASSDDRLSAVAAVVKAFSPVALACAAIVVATGVASAWLRLGGLEPLWSSTYGRVLLLKLGGLAMVLAVGAYNWRVLQPALGAAPSTLRLRRSASIELLCGAAVVAITAVLVAVPTPLD